MYAEGIFKIEEGIQKGVHKKKELVQKVSK
jgi:hypothetical protein